jgi:hypothetical protein
MLLKYRAGVGTTTQVAVMQGESEILLTGGTQITGKDSGWQTTDKHEGRNTVMYHLAWGLAVP